MKTILVVDDDPVIRDIIHVWLYLKINKGRPIRNSRRSVLASFID